MFLMYMFWSWHEAYEDQLICCIELIWYCIVGCLRESCKVYVLDDHMIFWSDLIMLSECCWLRGRGEEEYYEERIWSSNQSKNLINSIFCNDFQVGTHLRLPGSTTGWVWEPCDGWPAWSHWFVFDRSISHYGFSFHKCDANMKMLSWNMPFYVTNQIVDGS